MLLEHYQAMLDHYGTDTGVRMARKHLGWYTRGLHGSADFRNRINFVDNADAVMQGLRDFYAPLLEREAAGLPARHEHRPEHRPLGVSQAA